MFISGIEPNYCQVEVPVASAAAAAAADGVVLSVRPIIHNKVLNTAVQQAQQPLLPAYL